MDITNLTLTQTELANSTMRATVRGTFDTHDSRGNEAKIDFLFIAFRRGHTPTLDMTLLDGTELVANDMFDYSEEDFGYVPARLDPSDWVWRETDHGLLFLELDYQRCEKTLLRRCGDALVAAEEAANDAFLNVLTNEITCRVSHPVQ